jgi:membrane associated rhomboid family serine protease
MDRDRNAPPLNPLPWAVWALALPMIAVEIVVQAGAAGFAGGAAGVGWRLDAVQRLAFVPDHARQLWAAGVWPPEALLRVVGYPFIHTGALHAVFVVVMLLALGKFVGEVFRWWALIAVFFGSAAGAAALYALVPDSEAPLIGGYPPVYGLIGAFSFLLWTRLAAAGANRWRAFSLIGFLLVAQVVFGALFGWNPGWGADLAGFAVGFVLSFAVSPGGWRRMLVRLRQR